MFRIISRLILRNRIALLITLTLVTVYFGWQATKISLSYEFAKILPAHDPDFKAYNDFKKQFGEDGTVMVIGIADSQFFQLHKFNDWYNLGKEIMQIEGIEAVVSEGELFNIVKNEEKKAFDIKPLVISPLKTQHQLDSIVTIIDNLPFYEGFIRNGESGARLMAITFDKTKINTKNRIEIVKSVKDKAEAFGKKHNLKIHISGMPYIRTAISGKVVHELKLFLILALLVCSLVLMFFFRNLVIVFFSVIVVCISVVWSLGIIQMFGYKITVLSGLIPPILIVIGIPNAILLLNKYHRDFRKHGNKIKALQQMVQRIGITTFLANVTTAIGFFVFYFTRSNVLMEFGLVASVCVMSTWIISLILIPVIFSYLPPPKVKHTRHVEAKKMSLILKTIDHIVHKQTSKVYITVVVICLIALYGTTKLGTVGYVVDDLPKNDPVFVDMKFFEKNFKGVLPLEFSIGVKEKKGIMDPTVLQKLNRLSRMLSKYPELSKPLTIVDGIKFSYQALNDGDRKFYILPGALDLARLNEYTGEVKEKQSMFKSFLDSNQQTTRVSVQMADIGSVRMNRLMSELQPRVDSIFPEKKFDVKITGNSLIFLKGNSYLFKNLIESIALAIILISILMFGLFVSLRMILFSIVPSVIPLLITAGIMGFAGVSLKPSTILIFSIAFGIASDQTIYFLTRYRQEIRHRHVAISKAVSITIAETGISMIYTAIILFSGFFIFTASDFGGTAALGKLISVTLLVAMLTNIILLPCFLISFERRLTTRAFLEEPLIDVYDEEEDIEVEELEIKKKED